MPTTLKGVLRDNFAVSFGADSSSIAQTYVVASDVPEWDPVVVVETEGLPARGDPWPTDESLIVRNISPEPQPGAMVWHVRVEWQTLDRPEGGDIGPDPTTWDAEYEWTAQPMQVPAVKDKDGGAITNSAGEPPDPGIVKQSLSMTLRVTQYEDTDRSSTAADVLSGVVNSAGFAGKAARTMLCVGVSIRPATVNGQRVFQEDWSFSYKPETWDEEYLDQGFYQISPDDPTQRRRIVDDQGEPITAAVQLDGAGAPLDVGGEAVFITKRIYGELNFNLLNLRIN
jgi:hypothetical protein